MSLTPLARAWPRGRSTLQSGEATVVSVLLSELASFRPLALWAVTSCTSDLDTAVSHSLRKDIAHGEAWPYPWPLS